MATFSREEIQDGWKRLGELAQAQGLRIRLTLGGRLEPLLAMKLSALDLWESLYGSD